MAPRKAKRPLPNFGWALYLRTSDEEAQNPALSQERQRFAIQRALLEHSDMPFFREYIDNLTGKTPKRTNYQQMLEDARTGRFSHVAVERADRFGRNDTEALRAIDELNDFGVAIRFADQPDLDPMDPDDRILVALRFTLARRESILMGLRIQGGLHAKMRGGGHATLAPDGYRNMEERTEKEQRTEYGKYKHWIEPDPDQFKVWRLAWDLLLEDRLTLEAICEELHARGYRFRTGRPFVEIRAGKRKSAVNGITKKFHNWFYAGWVVSETAGIPPKTVRGDWEPVVTTEEFEDGLAILARRTRSPNARRKHDYLLRRLVYLIESPGGRLTKLTCSTSNVRRAGGGTAYYQVAGQNVRVLCREVDEQIPAQLMQIQVDTGLLPAIRACYQQDVAERLGFVRPDERAEIEAALKALDEEEARTVRLFAAGKISEAVWDNLWREWQDRRQTLRFSLASMEQSREIHITHLDAALKIIAKVGILYSSLGFSDQKELLRLIVERVIVSSEGKIVKLDLLPPFAYLNEVSGRVRGAGGRGDGKAKSGNLSSAASCSTSVPPGGPEGI